MVHKLTKILLAVLLISQAMINVLPMDEVHAAIDTSMQQINVAAGNNFALFLTVDGKVKATGYGSNGELGLGSTTQATVPTEITGLTDVKQLAAGSNSAFALLKDGSVKAWGYNSYYGLGLADTASRNVPTVVPNLINVKQIAAGQYFAAAVLKDGTVKSWGYNSYGQLGNGTTANATVPTLIPNLSNVSQISVGPNYMMALLNDGTVKSWGYNGSGQLGLGNSTTVTIPTLVPNLTNIRQIAAGYAHVLALLSDGTVKAWGSNSYGELGLGTTTVSNIPMLVQSITNVDQVVAGTYSSYAIFSDGTTKSWGYNNNGQLGLGDSTNRTTPTLLASENNVAMIVAGMYFGFIVRDNYTVRVMGYNGNYQLGMGDTSTRVTPVDNPNIKVAKVSIQIDAVNNDFIVASRGEESFSTYFYMNGVLRVWGDNSSGELGTGDTEDRINPTVVPNITDLKQLASGQDFALALLENGTVKGWGGNRFGELGTGDLTNKLIPSLVPNLVNVKQLATGETHTLALLQDGTVKSWGGNSLALGLNSNNSSYRSSPTIIPNLVGVKQVATGIYHSLALMEDGTVKSWGSNENGQLGLSDTTGRNAPVTIAGLSGVKQIAASGYYTLALMEDGTVKGWGSNSSGQLGANNIGSIIKVPTVIPYLSGVKQIVAGGSHAFATLNDGTIKGWGDNSYGQVGSGNIRNDNMGSPETLYFLQNVRMLAAGMYSSYALKEDGSLMSWGYNDHNQLGLGTSYVQLQTIPSVIKDLTGVKQLTAGDSFSLALSEDAKAYTWGQNFYGQLGNGTSPSVFNFLGDDLRRIKQLIAGDHYSLALMLDGTVMGWGMNTDGLLDSNNKSNRLEPDSVYFGKTKQLAAGRRYILALLEDGTVQSWGANNKGQLGIGNLVDQSSPKNIAGLGTTKQVATGINYSVALLSNGTVKSWGDNSYGQLGTGDKIDRLVPTLVPGLTGVKQIISNGTGTFALLEDGTVKSWGNGSNFLGSVANNSAVLIPTTIPDLKGVKILSAGAKYADRGYVEALMEDGTVKSWGSNSYGQLGMGNTKDIKTPTINPFLKGVTQLAAGYTHSLALMEDGSVKSWGSNDYGEIAQLGGNQFLPVAAFQEQPFLPRVKLSGPMNTLVTVKYFLDNEAQSREEKNIKLSGDTDIVTFNSLKKDNLTKGNHTIRYEVSDGIQMNQVLGNFSMNDVPIQYTLSTVSTSNDIKASVIFNGNAGPYRFSINDKTTGWSYSPSYNSKISSLTPNKKYIVKFEVQDSLGNITTENRDAYTLAADPALALSGTTPTTASFNISDTNPSNTQYQLTTGNSTVDASGNLSTSPVWITLTNKKITVKGLTSGKSYKFQIKARNQEGIETASPTSIQVGPPAKLPVQPQNVKGSVTSNSAKLSWNAVQDATEYEIEVNSGQVISNGSSLVYSANSLASNTVYTYRVRAVNNGIKGPWSTAVVVRTLLPLPTLPGNINAIPTSKTVSLQWNDVLEAMTYEVEWDGQLRQTSKSTQFKAGGLVPGSQHTYRIRALNSGGASPWSQRYTVMTLTTLPTIPTELKADAEEKKVRLSWKPIEDASYYEIEADGIVVIKNSMSNASEIAGLEPGSTHQYRVRGVNEVGSGDWSSPISCTTFFMSTPSKITDNVQDVSIELNWSPVLAAVGYDVEVDGQIRSIIGSTYKQEGLTPETTHVYRIRAKGVAGISGWSLPITLTTLPLKPIPPTHVNAVAGKDYVTVTWEKVQGAQGYDVELDGQVVVNNFEDTTYRDILLDSFTPHTYRVRATTDAVQGDWSKMVTLATLPDFPAAPQNIQLSSSGSIVNVTWDADPTAQGYDIEVDGKVEDMGMHTSYQHRRIAKGSEHKYRIRTRNAAGNGDWTGLIVNNTMTAKLTKKQTVDLGLTASDVTDFSRYTLMVNYDSNALTVVDLSMITGTPELSTGKIAGTDITVTAFKPGQIVFTTDKVVNIGESWTGVLNSIKFRANVSGGSSLTYTVIQKAEPKIFTDSLSYVRPMEF
ncbi:alpha-tubulin suppressor-like RCC1 family protein [Paenibacillus shirakamiensis]|uniref:Alpha-tubulin suppressor-like RCC1 family protein n=1 Tax=Paenibacillus shirakamiensis TaxID=1265935 RepID=A0ABS4JGD0_9BACL|nr:hypothetical protein [Paenibacillus shirakamiensis]MBP2000772.1 alpha-tubulin suppressor-like RCC1 family protein [Paenibacillus shirakamiensis]